MVECLLERQANVAVHERRAGLSPLHFAAAQGNSCCLKGRALRIEEDHHVFYPGFPRLD